MIILVIILGVVYLNIGYFMHEFFENLTKTLVVRLKFNCFIFLIAWPFFVPLLAVMSDTINAMKSIKAEKDVVKYDIKR
jgi:hypothetical protein